MDKSEGMPPHEAALAGVQREAGRARLLVTSELAAAQAALASAKDELEILQAVASHVERYRPKDMQLFYVEKEQPPTEYWSVAAWDFAAGPLADSAPQVRLRLADWELAPLWRIEPEAVCVIADLAGDSRLGEDYKHRCAQAGCAATVLVPLYSKSQRTWQGVLKLNFATPHTPDDPERLTYELLAHTVSAFVTIRRQAIAHQEAVDALNALTAASASLGEMDSLAQSLRQIMSWAIDRGAHSTLLSVIELDAHGVPDTVEIMSEWRAQPKPNPPVGAKLKLSDLAMSRLWIDNPEVPLLIGDIAADPRVDERARQIFRARNAGAIVILPLRVRGRWVGLLSASWPSATVFDERDARVYKAIAGYAAIFLDNRLLFERTQATLRENQHQRSALQSIVNHMPVGVVVAEVPSGKTVLVNAKGIEFLGRGLAPDATPDSYAEVYKTLVPGTDQLMPSADLPLVRTMATGLPHQGELDLVQPDGTRISLMAHAGPILDEAGVMTSAAVTFVDVTERKRAEAERSRIQHEMITVQAAALAERGTPLIPISDEILVLPLIGALDTERGQQLMDVLLHGVSQSSARVAIIDITGVRTLDTQAANSLTSAAQALRLLGVEPVLTGIRAEVAQTLVSLGVPLAGIVTRSTLQSGIAYANRKKGGSGTAKASS